MFHTASIWLTLALALQRYIYVCHAPVARTYCSMPRVLKLIGIVFFCAACHQAPRLFDRTYRPIFITWEGNPNVMVCRVDMAYWVTDVLTMDVYFFSYYMFRVLFVHLLPCISLVVLNVLLFKALRQAQDKRNKLLKENRKSECRKLRDSNCTTLMLIVVVTVFLLVEIPLAVVTILHIISSSVKEILNYTIVNTLILFTNFFIIVSYPINFAIYCGMSRQFRETFRELFLNGSGGPSKTRRGQRINSRPTGGGAESSHYTLVNNNGPQRSCTETAL
ncbi:Mip Receptor [Frankliniella occidentalis]|uniref:Sex peptide receptor n=1 Tax=Frankliniella occidentalis TaxID=133901 RepID=A0A9C6U7Y7_FRAOC|nr:sex peptide receptor [Frankliniella occidentalis]KAE8745601.1 Mip Receptor [Frankliniella occidentalis]